MIEEIIAPLASEKFLNDQRYRNGHIRIINALPGVRIMGLHTPEMKFVAKELARRGDALEMIGKFEKEAVISQKSERQSLFYEEKVIWGLMINIMKLPAEQRFGLLRTFVPHIDNWAVCDLVCCAAKWANACPQEELWDFLQPYFKSDREFEVRFAVIMSMSYLMDPAWLTDIFERLDELSFNNIHSDYISAKQAENGKTGKLGKGIVPGEPPYYVRMGVAWFLATALAKFPDETRRYIAVSRLPENVIKLYVRKARESFRTKYISPY